MSIKLDDSETKNPYEDVPPERYQKEGRKLSKEEILKKIRKLNLVRRKKNESE